MRESDLRCATRIAAFGIVSVALGLGACIPANDANDANDPSPSAEPDSVPNYAPITGLAGKCLDAKGGATVAQTPLIIWTCHGGVNQAWHTPAQGVAGQVQLSTGRCLGVDSTADASQAVLLDCGSNSDELWTWTASKELAGPGGKCLDVRGSQSTDGTSAILYPCHGGANQTWQVGAAGGGGGITTSPPSPPSPPAHNFGFANGQGPNTIDTMSDADITRLFQLTTAPKGNLVRIAVDSVNDTQFANQFALATQAGMKVLPCIMGTATTGATAFAAIAKDVAQSYASKGVTKIELGNEWNNSGAWQGTPNATLATQYTKAAYAAVKSVAPSIVVVSAGLSPYGSYGDASATGVNPITFLEQEYTAGIQGSFDELGWHPYNFGQNFTAAQMLDTTTLWSAWAQMAWTTPSARSVMAAHSDGSKLITATESGGPTNGSGYTAGISEAVQAQWMTQAVAAWKTFSWAGDLLIYTNNDHGTSATDREDHFGVIRTDWTAKPALATFKAAVAQ